MRKSTRLVSLLLVLLMLVGMMPLALFATDEVNDGGAGEAVAGIYHDGKPVGLPTDDQLKAAGVINKLRVDLNSFTISEVGGITDATNTGSLGFTDSAGALNYTKEADGNIAVLMGKGTVSSNGSRIQAYPQANLGGKTNGNDFVFQMDVKLTADTPVSGSLMTAMSRVAASYPVSVGLVSLGAGGVLTDGAGHRVGTLNSGTYTTVAVKVDLTQNKYWIYVNGVCQYPEGVTFLSATTVKEFQDYLDGKKLDGKNNVIPITATDTEKYGFAAGDTFEVTKYWLEGIRILQSAVQKPGDVKLLPVNSILMDNFALYYKATGNGIDYVNEFEAGADEITDAFVSENGAFYYVRDGIRLSDGTFAVEGGSTFKFARDGKVLSVEKRTSLVDFVKQFTDPKTNKKYAYDGNSHGTGLYLAQYPINSDTYMYVGNGAGMTCTLTRNTALSAVDALNYYDTAELNVYTDEVQENTFFYLNVTYKDPTGGSARPRIRYEFNLSDGAITGYNSSGSSKVLGGGTALAAPVDGWASVRSAKVIKENGVIDIAEDKLEIIAIYANMSGVGDTTYNLDENGNVMLNNSTFAFTAINLVKFGDPATSLDEINGGGWTTVYDPSADTAATYYYATWKSEYVKDAVIEDKGVGYAFDAEGKLIGYADGVHTVQDGKTYLYMNGVKAIGGSDGKVTYKGVTYKVYGDGVVSTATVLPFFDYGYVYDNPYSNCTNGDSVDYISNYTFDDLKINGKETGFYGIFNEAGYTGTGLTTVYGNLNLAHKFSSFELLYKEGSTTDKALRLHNWGNHYHDAYVNYSITPETQLVLEYDIKLGTDWDTTASMMQLISRYTKADIFDAVARVDATGIVYIEDSKYTRLVKLSTEEYTHISYALEVRDTGKTAEVELDNETKNVSLYDVYADIYVNGVKLIDEMLVVDDQYVPDMKEFRMFQYGNANTGSIYLDNFRVYSAAEPAYVAKDVQLKNGFVKEGNIVRYYTDGIMTFNTAFEVPEIGSMDEELLTYKADANGVVSANNGIKYVPLEKFGETAGFLNTGGTRVEYGYEGYNGNVLVRDQLIGYEFLFFGEDTDASSYDRLLVDIYLPEGRDYKTGELTGKPADSYLNFVVGENERFYPLTLNPDGTYSYDPNNFVTSGIGRIKENGGYVTVSATSSDGKKVSGHLSYNGNDRTQPYLRTWIYDQKGVDLATLNVGWNTVEFKFDPKKQVDKIQISHSGWESSTNAKKPWYHDDSNNAKDILYFEKANGDVSYPFAIANLRFVDNGFGVTETPGWNSTETEYNYMNEALTGLHRIDGLYYNFDNNGVLADGLIDVPSYIYQSGKLLPVTVKREFVEGKLLTIDTNGYTLGMDGEISVNYYLNLGALPKSDTYVEFTVNGEIQKFNLKDAVYDADYGYKVTVSIPAAEMTDTISAVVKYADGTVLYTFEDYSAIEYAKTILTSDNYGANAKAAVTAMLNYASAAQVQFSHNLDKLANSILTDPKVNDNKAAINAAAIATKSANIAGVTYKSTALGLEGETAIYHFFNVTDTNLDNYTIVGGTEAVMLGNVLRVKVAGIKAASLASEYSVSVEYGGETISVTANAFAYAKAVVNSSSVSASLVNVINALYDYYAAAAAYSAAPNA